MVEDMLRCRLVLSLLFVGCVFAPSAPGPLKTNDLALAIAADIRGGDWPQLIRDYEAYARKHKESDTNIMYLEKVQLDISKATSTQAKPLDSFQLGWKWHASYEKCHQAYKDLKQHLHTALSARTVPGINIDYIGHLIDLGACLDARPRDQVELSIFEAIVDALSQLRNQEEGNIDSTVSTLSALFSSRYNNPSTQHSVKVQTKHFWRDGQLIIIIVLFGGCPHQTAPCRTGGSRKATDRRNTKISRLLRVV